MSDFSTIADKPTPTRQRVDPRDMGSETDSMGSIENTTCGSNKDGAAIPTDANPIGYTPIGRQIRTAKYINH